MRLTKIFHPACAKKLLLSLSLLLCLSSVFHAQELTDVQKAALEAADAINRSGKEIEEAKPIYWKNSFKLELGLNQTAFVNWAAGGYANVALNAAIDLKADYAKDLISWKNRLQLDYGFLWSADKADLLQKSNDRIYFQSNFGYKTSKKSKWSYSANLDFKTQFSNSYDDYKRNEEGKWYGTLKSGFLSPAYTNISLGMEWEPCKWFNLNLSPLTGGITTVTNEELRKNYGMELKSQYAQETSPLGYMYNSSLFQLGAQIKADVDLQINDNFTFETQLVLFTNYLKKPFVWNRVNWDVSIGWKVARFFKIGLNTWLIYDPLVTIDDVTSKVQFKEFLSVNFVYVIDHKRDK